MNRLAGIVVSMILLSIVWIGCRSSVQSKISDVIDIDISGGTEIANQDTHGGSHGDGLAFAAYQFSDDTVLKQIEESNDWNEFPLSEELIALAYGNVIGRTSIAPYITDEETRNPLLPQIQNGYYYFLDRQTGENTAEKIFGRPSHNFTFLIYDTDADRLYYAKYDS